MALVKTQTDEPITTDAREADRDCASLIVQLEASDPTARRWAARDLVDCPDASPVLVACLKQEADVSVREVILTTLTSLGDATAVAGLVDCLRSEEPALRNEAIEAMQQLPDEVAPIMRGLLADSDPDVRIFAVNILESLCHPEVETWLIEVIDHDSHVNVCGTAVDLLGEVGTVSARESLLRLKVRFADEPYIRFATDLALGRLREA
ncbi:HEAT repeat domain-containing protein [Thiorhodovibrio frisius]|uniref:HEAT repeat protein n=1 Tax=Thiorhodovibrio frisius TaxID=631362 RepID=H8YYR6_9GAMM|nr:HEAT repeat domain-containing protein [Thiorhodovibrio frisius]EIC23592.1 HEAT repeat protein [Thiorhodovibrio frisius]WPL23321.1 HEAT repeat [Thiorhodovibrio frisius]